MLHDDHVVIVQCVIFIVSIVASSHHIQSDASQHWANSSHVVGSHVAALAFCLQSLSVNTSAADSDRKAQHQRQKDMLSLCLLCFLCFSKISDSMPNTFLQARAS